MENLPAANADDTVYCARHPNVETYLRCGRCDTPICPRCMVQTPVGARCPACANERAIPAFDVPLSFFLRGLAAAAVSGFVVGVFWGYISGGRGIAGFALFFIGIGVGWAISESVSFATRRRRGVSLQIAAVSGVVIAFFVRNIVVLGVLLPRDDIWVYIAAGIAGVFASTRMRF
jgi:hypothetical protein